MNRTPNLTARLAVEPLEGRELAASLRPVLLAAPPSPRQPAVIVAPRPAEAHAAGQDTALDRHLAWVSGLQRNHNETLLRDGARRRG